MAIESYGGQSAGLSTRAGDVTADNGATIISTDSLGSNAILTGQALQREIQTGVANGDFSLPNISAGSTINNADEALPYWTFTDSSSGIITPSIIASASTAMGNALRFSIAATTSGKSVTFTRYVPIAGNANRIYSYIAQLYRIAVSGTAGDKANVKITITLAAAANDLTALTKSTTSNYTAAAAAATLTTTAFTPDATAAYLLLTLKVETTGTISATTTIDFSEIRTVRGDSLIPITDDSNPDWQPALIQNSAGILSVIAASNAGSGGGWSNSIKIYTPIDSRGFYASEVVGASGATSGSVYAGDNGASNYLQIYSNSTPLAASYYGNIYSRGVQILGWQSDTIAGATVTPKVFIYQDTVLTDTKKITSSNATPPSITLTGATINFQQGSASGDFNFKTSAGNQILAINNASNVVLETTGGYRQITPPTTTQTTSAAIWFNTSGTTWELRRNSSSNRYKTNITDADSVVLEAAKKIRPRHYQSTIDSEGDATRLGFIAEEIDAAGLTHAVGYDADGRPETIDPTALIAALYHRVNELEERLAALESK
jgi:hypothetical protein